MSALVKAFRRAPPDVRANLLKLLGTHSEQERLAAVSALSASGFQPAAEAMMERLHDPSTVVVRGLLDAINILSPGLARGAAQQVLKEGNAQRVPVAREFLAGLPTIPALPRVEEPNAAERILADPELVRQSADVGNLASHLRSPNSQVRQLAINRLAELCACRELRRAHEIVEINAKLLFDMRQTEFKVWLELLRSIAAMNLKQAFRLAMALLTGRECSMNHRSVAAEFIVRDASKSLTELADLVEHNGGEAVAALTMNIACYRFEEALGFCKLRLASASDNERLETARFVGLLGKYTWDDPPDTQLEVRRRRCAEALVPLLRDSDGRVRKMALTALSEHKWPQIGEEAGRMLKDDYREVRKLAVEILGETGDQAALPWVWGRRQDEDEEVRETALEMATRLAPGRKTEIALSFLTDKSAKVAEKAAKLLESSTELWLLDECLSKLKSAAGESGRVILELIDRIAPERLSEAVEAGLRGQKEVRLSTIGFAANSEVPNVLEILTKALEDRHFEIRVVALRALARRGANAWREATDRLSKDKQWNVRKILADVIAEHGNPADAPTIHVLLSDEDRDVRQAAFDAALKVIGEDEDLVLRFAGDESRSISETALNILAKSRPTPERIQRLVAKLKTANDKSGLGILQWLKDKSPEHLAEAIVIASKSTNSATRLKAVELLKQSCPSEQVDTLKRLCRDKDADVRGNALKQLYDLQHQERTPFAIESLRDRSSRIRAEALEALGAVIEQSLASDALPKAFDERSSKIRAQAFEALCGIDPSLVREILPLARDEDKDVRLQAIKVLAHFDDRRVFSELISSLNDVEEDVQSAAREILESGPEKVPVLQRFEDAGKEQPLWERVQEKVEAINAWASQIGQELLGQPVSVQQYRQGVGRTAHRKKNQPVEIEVSDTPVTSGHPYGEEIMMGIALHEIGHHLADIGQRGHSTMRGIARSEGVGEIYDILIDERLERIMRSRRPEWGVYFDRLASYAFAQDLHQVPLSAFAGFLGLLPHKAREQVETGKLPGRLMPAAKAGQEETMLLRDSDFLSVPGAMPPLSAFMSCLRSGFDPKLCAEPSIAEAIALVPSNLKDLPHSEVLETARKIANLLGQSDAHKRRMNAWLQRVRSHNAAMRALLEAMQRMTDTGQVPDWMRSEAPGIRKNRPLRVPLPKGKFPGGQGLNLGKELKFDELPHERALTFDATEHSKLVAPIRRHVRGLRRYFERLGVRTVDDHAQKRGRRLDVARVRHAVLQRSPHMLVHSREEIAPDLYLGVLIDRSGSMGRDQKLEKAKAFAALVTESAKGLRGISGHVNAFDDKTFFRLGDLDHPAIAPLESDEGNNDAGALSKAAELALKSGKKNRLLIMISDGSPTECSVESLKNLVARLTRRGGFVCAQVAVDAMEEICFPHFVDLSKYPLDEAVGRFGKLLMKLTEAWR